MIPPGKLLSGPLPTGPKHPSSIQEIRCSPLNHAKDRYTGLHPIRIAVRLTLRIGIYPQKMVASPFAPHSFHLIVPIFQKDDGCGCRPGKQASYNSTAENLQMKTVLRTLIDEPTSREDPHLTRMLGPWQQTQSCAPLQEDSRGQQSCPGQPPQTFQRVSDQHAFERITSNILIYM